MKLSDKLIERYNEFIRSIELYDMYLSELTFKKETDVEDEDQVHVKIVLKPTKNEYRKIAKDLYEVTHRVLFRLEQTDADKNLFELKATYKIIFRTEMELTDDIFKIFSRKNIPLNIIPFLRELIHNCMYRAGLPPLLIPFKKFSGKK